MKDAQINIDIQAISLIHYWASKHVSLHNAEHKTALNNDLKSNMPTLHTLFAKSNAYLQVRPKKTNPVFRATRPYLSEPGDPRLFLRKYRFFRWGFYN